METLTNKWVRRKTSITRKDYDYKNSQALSDQPVWIITAQYLPEHYATIAEENDGKVDMKGVTIIRGGSGGITAADNAALDAKFSEAHEGQEVRS